jgi:type I restriction enzyme R subunit
VVDGQGKSPRSRRRPGHGKTTKQVDKSYEIYLSLYQAVTGTEEERNIYKQFSPDFFDLIVVDECHRGSAAEDSAWRDILTYFGSRHARSA